MTGAQFTRLRASIAANTRWASVADRTEATRPMRDGFLAKLRREARDRLGPDATLEAVEKAAESALRAHYARMQLNSLTTRRANAEGRRRGT